MSRLSDLLREAGTEVAGQADATGQLLWGLAKQPVAGLTGASTGITSLLRGKGKDAALSDAVAQIERVNAAGPGPLTERGGQRLQEMGQTIEGAGDWATKNVPGVQAAGEGWDQYAMQNPAMAAGIAGLVEAGPGKGAGSAKRAAKSAIGKAKTAATVEALRAPVIDPELGAALANRYPEPGPPEMKLDKKKGTTYPGKKQSPEEQALWAARKLVQKDIDAGDYTPYYDVEKRFHTDPAQFPGVGDTQVSAQPAKQATRDQYAAQWDTPEIRGRLEAAYLKGAKDPKADRWYGMGQLVDDFNKELGAEGPMAFRQNFSHPMAATTAMSSPEMNLMQSAYGNYLRNKGMGLPEASHQIPSPVTGPSTLGNLQMYDKVVMQGQGLDPAVQPKRHNFAANFEGHVDPSTIDTRMMGGVDPTGKNIAPPGMTYGTIEKVAQDIGRKHGDTGADSQAKMWVGLGDEPTKPMIQVVNEAIERTHRITGKPKDQIVRDSLIKGTHPLYQAGGVAAGGAALAELLRDEETAKGF